MKTHTVPFPMGVTVERGLSGGGLGRWGTETGAAGTSVCYKPRASEEPTEVIRLDTHVSPGPVFGSSADWRKP